MGTPLVYSRTCSCNYPFSNELSVFSSLLGQCHQLQKICQEICRLKQIHPDFTDSSRYSPFSLPTIEKLFAKIGSSCCLHFLPSHTLLTPIRLIFSPLTGSPLDKVTNNLHVAKSKRQLSVFILSSFQTYSLPPSSLGFG